MSAARYVDLFVSESKEHISAINRHLLAMEAGEGGRARLEELFRAVHTLKGMAGAMGFNRSAGLAHALEHLLDQLRAGALEADGEVTDALFAGVDELEHSIGLEVSGGAVGESEVMDRLQGLGGETDRGPDGAGAADAASAGGAVAGGAAAGGAAPAAGELEGPGRTVNVTLMVSSSTPLPAVRAILALKKARALGAIGGLDPDEGRLNAGDFNGKLVFQLRTDRDLDEVRDALLAAGEIAHVLVEEIEEAPSTSPDDGVARQGRGPVVRVNQERLDQLIDRVGELVMARDALRRTAEERDDAELSASADAVSRLVAELRDEVMHLRMVPVGEAFDRFPRLVRDAARSLGKQVRFSVSGGDVELDRSLLNELADLLVHLLRNAVDHGIEEAADREASGKPAAGEIRLSAWREGSKIAVRVEDDGRGIERERVKRAAVRLGLISEAEAEGFSDDELFAFLARPGFSTAGKVTDISGRGVGLDVVATRLQALGGTMEIHAAAGEGTAFTLKLPLSLAIVRCLQVAVGTEAYLVPLSSVREVVEVVEAELVRDDDGEWMKGREDQEDVPLLRMAPFLGIGDGGGGFGPHPVVVVETSEGGFGLVVDALVGQHESVLKPFDAAAGMLPVFAGAALMSDGRPSLVLDVNRIAALAVDPARTGELNPTADTIC